LRPAAAPGVEFVFRFSANRKNWHSVPVLLEDAALDEWERQHARQLSAAERYAIVKMALFQAFDERLDAAQMKRAVHVRAADAEAILAQLGIE